MQTYGLLLSTLLEQTIPLSSDIWYWDSILASPPSAALYTIQTSPLRLWGWAQDIYVDSLARLARLRSHPEDSLAATATDILAHWRTFYDLVGDSIRDRSLAALIVSPIRRSKKPHRID